MTEQWVLYRNGVPWGYYDSQSEGRAELMEHVRADEDAEWKLEDANISSTQGARHSAAQDDNEEDGNEQTSTDEH